MLVFLAKSLYTLLQNQAIATLTRLVNNKSVSTLATSQIFVVVDLNAQYEITNLYAHAVEVLPEIPSLIADVSTHVSLKTIQ